MLSTAEDFRKKLIEDTRRKAEDIIRGAEEEAKRIIEEAEKQRKAIVEREKQKIIDNAKRKAELIVSDARRKARLVVSKARLESIEDIVSKAYSQLISRNGFDPRKSLESLFYESLNYIKNPEKVVVNPRDKEVMENVLRERGFINIKVEISEEVDGGLILVSQEGERVDNTYRTRLTRVRESLTPILVKKLWSK